MISADSRTFSRSKRFNIEVQWPVEVKTESENKPAKYKIWIKPRAEYLKPASLQPTVILQAPDESNIEVELIQIKDRWHGKVETSQEGVYQAHIKIKARSVADEAINLDIGLYPMIGVFTQTIQQDQDIKSPSEASETLNTEPKSDTSAGVELETQPASENSEGKDESDWVTTAIAIVVANILMLGVAAGVWFVIRRKKVDPELTLDEAEGDA